jgi:hypothetical protein
MFDCCFDRVRKFCCTRFVVAVILIGVGVNSHTGTFPLRQSLYGGSEDTFSRSLDRRFSPQSEVEGQLAPLFGPNLSSRPRQTEAEETHSDSDEDDDALDVPYREPASKCIDKDENETEEDRRILCLLNLTSPFNRSGVCDMNEHGSDPKRASTPTSTMYYCGSKEHDSVDCNQRSADEEQERELTLLALRLELLSTSRSQKDDASNAQGRADALYRQARICFSLSEVQQTIIPGIKHSNSVVHIPCR